MATFSCATVAGMKAFPSLENDIRYAETRHPVDFIEPLPNREASLHLTCEVLSRIFGWISQGSTLEQKGLRASVVLYCVRVDLLGRGNLEELSSEAGLPHGTVENLLSDFCHFIDWQ